MSHWKQVDTQALKEKVFEQIHAGHVGGDGYDMHFVYNSLSSLLNRGFPKIVIPMDSNNKLDKPELQRLLNGDDESEGSVRVRKRSHDDDDLLRRACKAGRSKGNSL